MARSFGPGQPAWSVQADWVNTFYICIMTCIHRKYLIDLHPLHVIFIITVF